jgi:NifU-like protein
MAWDYTEKVKEYYRNPKNVGEVENPDGVGEVGSMVCGDALRLTLKIDPESEKILDAKFQTFGCGSAIASSSALTELVIGKTVAEAEKLTNADIVDFLGGLPPEKMHCSVMGHEALEKAIADYRGETHAPRGAEEGQIVCECFGVTDKKIERAVRENNLSTVEEVTNFTKAGGGCTSCHETIRRIIHEVRGAKQTPPKQNPQPIRKLTNLQKIKRIEQTIEQEIRPKLQKDGGDLTLVDVDGDRVIVDFRGMCRGCPASHLTLEGIQQRLREVVVPELEVVQQETETTSR